MEQVPLSSPSFLGVYKAYRTYPDTPTVERIVPSKVSVPFTYYTLYVYLFSTSYSLLWSHLELVSESQTVVNSPPNIFNIMRLSSVSLIAAALTAIAGSVIAVPGPLHARALEDVNSLSKRDIDVYSREFGLSLLEREVDDEFGADLFTRTSHSEAAEACDKAAQVHSEIAKEEKEASKMAKEAAAKAWEAGAKASVIAGQAKADNHKHVAAYYSTQVDVHHADATRLGQKAIDHKDEADRHTRNNTYLTEMASKHRPNHADAKTLYNHAKAEATMKSPALRDVTAEYKRVSANKGAAIATYNLHPAVVQYDAAIALHVLGHVRQ